MNITKVKLSNRDKRILLFAAAALLFVATYRFVYFPNMQKCKEVQEENKALVSRERDLIIKNENLEKIGEENKKLQIEIESAIDRFGDGAQFEKTILFLRDLEAESGMNINVIGFHDPEYIYTSGQQATEQAAGEASIIDSASASGASDTNDLQSTESSANVAGAGVGGYSSTVTIDFKIGYEGLKKSVDFINQSVEKKNIKELKLVYDLETGNLSGSMDINMYHLIDTGRSKPKPAVAGVSIGTKNIFGTIEVPIDE